MRMLITLMALTLCVPFAAAREKRGAKAAADHRLAWVDDEPMSRMAAQPAHEKKSALAADSTGARRDIQIHMPLAPVANVGGNVSERKVADDPTPRREAQPVSGALEELARRQMRRHQATIDVCTAAAVRRTPAATGTVTLTINVGEKKVAHAEVSDATLKDAELHRCLVKAAEGWKFSLSHATFTWPVVLSPTASRL
jgi:hypothetical protein